MITTKSLVNIHHLRTPFLKGEHFPSVCILNMSHEILNHFLCMNSTARLKNQEQKPEARFPLKISWFSRVVHSLSPHLSITQKIVTLKGNRIEGWWASYISWRHPHWWHNKSEKLSGTKGEMSRDCTGRSSERKRPPNGPHLACSLNWWPGALTIRPCFSVPAFLFHLSVGSLSSTSVPCSPLSW